MNKQKIYNLILLDESGSMKSIEQATILGFNTLLSKMKEIDESIEEQTHFVSLVTFNGGRIENVISNLPVSEVKNIDSSRYKPANSTPLYDAIGISLDKLKKELDGQTDYKVLVTIFTDGFENSSKEFSYRAIRLLMDTLQETDDWVFSFVGTDFDVEEGATSLGIDKKRIMEFDKSNRGVNESFDKLGKSYGKISQDLKDKKPLKDWLFD